MTSPDLITIEYLILLFVIFPAAAIRAWRRLKAGKPQPPKPRRYRAMIAGQLFLLAFTALAASRIHFPFFAPTKPPASAWLLETAYFVVVAFGLRRGWKRMTPERKQRARRLLPENPSELRYWIPISLLAGISEEYAYRGVAFDALSKIFGSFALALAICVVGFSLAHAAQGWRGILSTMVLAVLFHVMVTLTQSLYLAIAFHVAYDLIVGMLAFQVFRSDAAKIAPDPVPA